MTKSEKIKLIGEIKVCLVDISWNELDFILNQFDIPNAPNDFSGVKADFVYARVGKASDSQLIALAQHVGLKPKVNIDVSKVPTFWKHNDFKIFISHLSTNKKEAHELKQQFETLSITGFVAHSDIEPSLEWQAEIELALKTCDALVALIKPRFHSSKWTDQEVGFAVCRNIPVFPVNMGALPYGFLAKYQAVPYHDDIKELAKRIYFLLLRNENTQKQLAFSILKRLADSSSFVDANSRSELIKTINFWDESLIQELRKIYSSCSQVNGAYKTENRIKSILNEFDSAKP